jgi:hypothetical protein
VGPIMTILDRLPSRLPFVTRVRAEMLGRLRPRGGPRRDHLIESLVEKLHILHVDSASDEGQRDATPVD